MTLEEYKKTTIEQDREEVKDGRCKAYEPSICCSSHQEFLEECTKEEITEELKERATIEKMQQNVDKVVVEYFKRHGMTYIANGVVCGSLQRRYTLEECIELFKNCDQEIINELLSLYAIIEQQKYSEARREGYASACRTLHSRNYSK